MSCLFCEIQLKKDNIVYETENIYVIFDRFPISDLHLLIIPKKHHDVIYKYEDNIVSELILAAMSLVKKLGIKSFNLLQNNINCQLIKHCHLHLIEANNTGRLLLEGTPTLTLDDNQYNELVKKIKTKIAQS